MISGGARARVPDRDPVSLVREAGLRGSSDVGLFAALPTPVFLVDGNNLLWRAAHAHPAPFTADDGRDITPLFRFFSMLRRAAGTYGVFAECVVCFDGARAWASRLQVDPAYKANRSYDQADLSFMVWLPEIKAALASAGVECVEIDDAESDDVIATIAAAGVGRPVRVLSTDRDYYQLLVDPQTAVVSSKTRPAIMDASTLRRAFGVDAAQWCDFRALAGDPSDGIPGLRGVGPKRAASLLAGGRRLEDLAALADTGCRDGRLVADAWADLCRWRELVRLRTDLDVPIELTGRASPRLPSAAAVCRELGLLFAA